MKKNILFKKDFLRYTLFFFFFTVIYQLIVVNRLGLWHAHSYAYTFYFFDYSFGFCMRFLPGAFYHLFFKEVVSRQLDLFLSILLLVAFFCVSCVFSKLVSKQKSKDDKRNVLILCLFFITGPGILTMLGLHLGIYELFWLFFALLFIVFLNKKRCRLLLPLLFVLSVFVYFTALFSVAVFFIVLLLFEALQAEGKERKIYLVILFLGTALALGFSLYFLAFERDNIRYSAQEFIEILEKRNSGNNEALNIYYFAPYFYENIPLEGSEKFYEIVNNNHLNPAEVPFLPKTIVDIINLVIRYWQGWVYALKNNLAGNLVSLGIILLSILPLLLHIYSYWIDLFKTTTQRAQKYLYAIIMLQFPFTLLACFVSTDIVRWITHAFVIQFALYLFIAYRKGDLAKIKKSFLFRSETKYIWLYWLIYSFVVLEPLG